MTISLNQLIKNNLAEFAEVELAAVDGLASYLAEKANLDPDASTLVIDTDELEPVDFVQDGLLYFRMNGRFFIPRQDAEGIPLKLSQEEWIEMIQEWMDENSYQAKFDDESEDLVKFTASIPAVELPEEWDVGSDADLGDQESEDLGEEGGEDFEEDVGEEEPDAGEDSAEEDDSSTIEELEELL